MSHDPSNPGCPRNADPRNETCGCAPHRASLLAEGIKRVESYFENDGRECDSCSLFSRWQEAHGETMTACAVLDGYVLVHYEFRSGSYTPDDCPGL